MDVDPAASMQLWAIEVQLGGRIFDIPALPAINWWPVITSGNPTQILDLITSDPEDPDSIDEQILAGTVTGEEIVEAALDAIEAAAGRPFQAAFMIAEVANRQWAEINGALVRRGFRWEGMPLGSALDAIYSLVTEGMKAEDRTKFDALLDRPLAMSGHKRRPADTARAFSEFEALAGPRPTGGVTATAGQSGSARSRIRQQPPPALPSSP